MTTPISFEFFPPKSDDTLATLIKTAKTLCDYGPEYFSVTYGAGGSTQTKTIHTVETLAAETGVPVAPHLSCIGSTRATIATMLEHYQSKKINRLVCLRGDLPSGLAGNHGDFTYASDLVRFIRDTTGDYFHIEIAAYPQCHPQSRHISDDIIHFKTKVDAGANAAITQYFYNADAYEQFLEDCAKAHITIPIIPGIMPITNYTQLSRFSDMCGAEIPKWIRTRLEGFGDDTKSLQTFGTEVVGRLCEKLLTLGAPGLHFYTLNKLSATTAILNQVSAIAAK